MYRNVHRTDCGWNKGIKEGGRSLKKLSTTSFVVLPYSPVSSLTTRMYASCKITSSTLLRWSLFNRVPRRGRGRKRGRIRRSRVASPLGFYVRALCVASRYRVAKANLCSRSRSSRANESRSLGGLIGGCIVNHPIKAAYPWKGEPPPA